MRELEGAWTVDGLVSGDDVSPVPAGVKATISFEDGRIHVRGGCNSGSADGWEVDGRTITFGPLVSTLVLCGPDEMAVEHAVFTALGRGEVTYRIDGGAVTLTNAEGAGLRLRR